VQIIAVAAIFASGIIYLIYLYRQAEIARANAAKSRFLSQMSHEIGRLPFNAAIGLSEIEPRGSLPDFKVLVVDDLPTNLQVARGLLAPYGLQVDTAVSGQEAIEKVKSGDYDLIFIDHMMPEMDGIETAVAIRKLEMSVKHTPIIALTANALHGMRELYLEKGFDDYLSKPISPEALGEVINKFFSEQITINNEQLSKNLNQNTKPPNHNPLLTEIEARQLDKLNHYHAAFELNRTGSGQEMDIEYYRRFAALDESFNALPDNLQAERALLAEAGRNGDAKKIREALPAFCENIAAIHLKKMNNKGTENEMVDGILQRLKKAIEDGDTSAAGKIVTEMGAKNLAPAERELYFKLYDLLMDDNTEKALEVIKTVVQKSRKNQPKVQ